MQGEGRKRVGEEGTGVMGYHWQSENMKKHLVNRDRLV